MAMTEFEDHSEENQEALLAYLAAERAGEDRNEPRGDQWRHVFARLAKWNRKLTDLLKLIVRWLVADRRYQPIAIRLLPKHNLHQLVGRSLPENHLRFAGHFHVRLARRPSRRSAQSHTIQPGS